MLDPPPSTGSSSEQQIPGSATSLPERSPRRPFAEKRKKKESFIPVIFLMKEKQKLKQTCTLGGRGGRGPRVPSLRPAGRLQGPEAGPGCYH